MHSLGSKERKAQTDIEKPKGKSKKAVAEEEASGGTGPSWKNIPRV